MPTLEITEYADDVGFDVGPQVNWQALAIAAAPVQSPLSKDTRTVVLLSDTDCRVAIGGNAWAYNSGAPLSRLIKANVEARLSVRAGERISVAAAAGAYSRMTIAGAPAAGASTGTNAPFAPNVAGGSAPYVLSLIAAATRVPPGRSIVGGSVVGAYFSAGTYNYVVRATDALGQFVDLPVAETVASAASVPFQFTDEDGDGFATEDGGISILGEQ